MLAVHVYSVQYSLLANFISSCDPISTLAGLKHLLQPFLSLVLLCNIDSECNPEIVVAI